MVLYYYTNGMSISAPGDINDCPSGQNFCNVTPLSNADCDGDCTFMHAPFSRFDNYGININGVVSNSGPYPSNHTLRQSGNNMSFKLHSGDQNTRSGGTGVCSNKIDRERPGITGEFNPLARNDFDLIYYATEQTAARNRTKAFPLQIIPIKKGSVKEPFIFFIDTLFEYDDLELFSLTPR